MHNLVDRFYSRLDILLKYVSAIAFGSMTVVIFMQVISRYVLKSSLAWSEELARYLFIWITFVGGMVAARKHQHIGMEIVQDLFPKGVRKYMKSLASLVSAVFFFAVGISSIFAWPKLMAQVSAAMEVPMAIPYLGIIIGSLLMGLWYLTYAVQPLTWKKGELE